ncbi:MAG: hypothetical protein ACLP62_10405 [Acidimicrobiales bacterium]
MESTAQAHSYQPGSGEPLVVVGQIANGRRPTWRRRIETLTEMTVGLVGSLRAPAAGQDRPQVRTDGTMRGDTLLGLALDGQRVALDAAELVVDTGAWVARATSRLPAVRASTATASRVFEPARRRGAMYRTEATSLATKRVPVYVGSAANAALDVVPLGDILEHVDLNAVLSKIDLNQLLDQLDLNAVVSKIDLTALVEETDLGAIIAHSTGGLASEGLDVVRRQGIGLDSLIFRWAARAMPKRLGDAPEGPPLLLKNDVEQP